MSQLDCSQQPHLTKPRGTVRPARIGLIFALLLVFLYSPIGPAPAGAAGKFTYFTCFQVQNLSGDSAQVTISYYDQSGALDTEVSDNISGADSKTYCPIHPSSGFDGSVIVSSDQSIAAVTNVLGDGGVASASYIGAQEGSTTVSLPLLMKDNAGYDTWINVQNAGTSTASITIDYSDGTNASDTIPVGASSTFDQSNETHAPPVFAGKITSDQPVAATVIEEDPSIMFAYSGFLEGSVDPVMPLINTNAFDYVTGVQIQNMDTSSTDVTVSYSPSLAGTACTETQTIPGEDSATFALNSFYFSPPPSVTTDCTLGEMFIGSAQVTGNSASNDLVVIVNQLKLGVNGEAYGGFDPAKVTDTVVLPLIMDRNVGWYTGFNIQNVGSSTTTVNCTFTDTSYTASDTLNPGEALTDVHLNVIADGYVGSATCTAGSGGKIAGVVNEVMEGEDDTFMVYEGISVP